ncbi:RNA polymerase sigma-70 factor [Chitinophaga sp. GCM10012297]|uniref:RNA polymerase sigma-70 factor n=1 Tax=Chitinophaga chungangae TaxID=2821488 RepID=A0ABS3YFP2_9BACT|nr:RNA polymerase sigma-70 factor [Chitinophaga chungangae]MBO9153495.1 RNA polymerase sigma-70 factor [Chitinophaga chungangae]
MDIALLQEQVAVYRNEEAYKQLFLHFYKGLVRFADTYVRQGEVAEELVSDAILKVWTMKEGLLNIHNLKVYLFKSVKNAAINYLVKNRNYIVCDIDNIAPASFVSYLTPEDIYIGRELKNDFAKAISQLPPKCQMAYKLVREEKFSYKEVAAIMEISENTVDRHLNIAMRRLADVFKTHRGSSAGKF